MSIKIFPIYQPNNFIEIKINKLIFQPNLIFKLNICKRMRGTRPPAKGQAKKTS